MPQEVYKTLDIFPGKSTDKDGKLERLLSVIDRFGPERDIIRRNSNRLANKSLQDPTLNRLEALGIIARRSGSNNEIYLTDLGEKVLQAEHVPVEFIGALCDTFVGFYDSFAILDLHPAQVSQIREGITNTHAVNWRSNKEAKKRLDWLRSFDLIELNESHEYTLTEKGREYLAELEEGRGPAPIFSQFHSDHATEDQSKSVQQENTDSDRVELPFVDRREKKIISIHVTKSDGAIDRFEETVVSDSTLEGTDEGYQGMSVRYWGCEESQIRGVDGLVRGDIVLFHHFDRGFMNICEVLDVSQLATGSNAHERAILFESVHDVGVERDAVFDVFDWSGHPKNGWVRLDTKSDGDLLEVFGSVEAFYEEIKDGAGEEFDFWAHDHWAIDRGFARRLDRQLRRKGQVILYGPPGTGKTFLAESFARWWTGKQPETDPTSYQTESVTFHPAFSYEDFVEGYTITTEEADTADRENTAANSDGENESPYGLKEGIFKDFCESAEIVLEETPEDRSPPRQVLVIDELNRGNVPHIFGEIITLLEKDKRGQKKPLSHSGDDFAIPENVYIIATMNTADQSISKLDAALRRRFAAMSLTPDYGTLYDVSDRFPADREEAAELVATDRQGTEALIAASVLALEIINKKITKVPGLGKGKRIGHAYLHPDTWQQEDGTTSPDTQLIDVWQYDILPLLEEYFFEDLDSLGQRVFQGEAQFLDEQTNDPLELDPEAFKDNLRTFVLDNQAELAVEIPSE